MTFWPTLYDASGHVLWGHQDSPAAGLYGTWIAAPSVRVAELLTIRRGLGERVMDSPSAKRSEARPSELLLRRGKALDCIHATTSSVCARHGCQALARAPRVPADRSGGGEVPPARFVALPDGQRDLQADEHAADHVDGTAPRRVRKDPPGRDEQDQGA